MTIPNCECALCLSIEECVDDGEAYICKDSEACKARQASAAWKRVNALFCQKLAAEDPDHPWLKQEGT